MKFFQLIPLSLLLCTTLSCSSSEDNVVLSDNNESSNYKVLSSDNDKLLSLVEKKIID